MGDPFTLGNCDGLQYCTCTLVDTGNLAKYSLKVRSLMSNDTVETLDMGKKLVKAALTYGARHLWLAKVGTVHLPRLRADLRGTDCDHIR